MIGVGIAVAALALWIKGVPQRLWALVRGGGADTLGSLLPNASTGGGSGFSGVAGPNSPSADLLPSAGGDGTVPSPGNLTGGTSTGPTPGTIYPITAIPGYAEIYAQYHNVPAVNAPQAGMTAWDVIVLCAEHKGTFAGCLPVG